MHHQSAIAQGRQNLQILEYFSSLAVNHNVTSQSKTFFLTEGCKSNKFHISASKHWKWEYRSWCYEIIACRCWNWAWPNVAMRDRKHFLSIIFVFLLHNWQIKWAFTSHKAWQLFKSDKYKVCLPIFPDDRPALIFFRQFFLHWDNYICIYTADSVQF